MKPANEITNHDIDYDEYMDSVMSQVFKHETFLKMNRRFKNVEDMKKLDEVRQYWKVVSLILMMLLRVFEIYW